MGESSKPPQSKITIRPGTVDDVAIIHVALLGLADAVGDTGKIKSTPDDIRTHGFGDQPLFGTLLAEVDGRFAGLSLFFTSFSTWFGKPGVYVQDLYVDPAFRGQGIGERLIGETAQRARARGATYMRLSVYADNLAAQGFYERIGMTWSKDEQIFAARNEAFFNLCAMSRSND